MATTTNYGWETPDDTDLVKDGALAIRTLGSSIDTTTKNLNPETTLGDIAYRSSTANTNTRLAIGTTGQVLTVSGGVPAWATPSTTSTFAGVRCTKSATQTISYNTITAVTWDVETFDTDSFHSTSTNTSRITIPSGKAGYYQFNTTISWTNPSGGVMKYISIRKNNTASNWYENNSTSGNWVQTLSDVLYGNVGDYFEVFCYTSNGSGEGIYSNAFNAGASNFSASFIGA